MEASIAAIASSDEDARAAGVEASSTSVLLWLASRAQSWFIIFDGADGGYEEVETFIPSGKCGSILISSRNPDMKRLASTLDAFLTVAELDEEAAVSLFTKSAGLTGPSPHQQAHVIVIVRELCCLPLAIDQAAASVASGLCRVDQYLDMYKRHRLSLMDDPLFKGSSNYGRAVYTTWDVSFTGLEHRANMKTSDSKFYETAILILRILSFLHFDGVREDMFRRAAMTEGPWLAPLQPDSKLLPLLQRTEENDWDPFHFYQATRFLTRFSLLHSNGSCTYSMHRLVHQWAQDRIPKSYRDELGLLAADVLTRSVNNRHTAEDYAHCRGLLVHLIPLTAHLKRDELMHCLSADALQRMARVYSEAGKATDAEALLRQAAGLLEAKDRSEDTESGQLACILKDLAYSLCNLGRFKEAEGLARQVLDSQEERLGTDHPSTAHARSTLATVLRKLGQYEAAKEIQDQLLEWHKKHLGMNHHATYYVMHCLASTLRKLGELAKAKELGVQVMEWRKRRLGMDHPATYSVMQSLANTLFKLGELAEAKELDMQVLEWRKKHLWTDHPETYSAIHSLSNTLYKLGELAEAKELQVQVMEWRKKHLGMDHPKTSLAIRDLTSTLYELGELAEAKELQVQVMEWRKEYLGMDDPSTYRVMHTLAKTLSELGELAEAKELQVQVMEWRKKHLGMDHPKTSLAIHDLTSTLYELGELAEVKELQVQVMEWRKEHLGMGDPSTYRAMRTLAKTLSELGELAEAKELQAQVTEWRKKHLGVDHPSTYRVMRNLANTLCKLGELTEAKTLKAQLSTHSSRSGGESIVLD
jgi:tetratricopeptide (TPR) repeat protein